MLEDHLESEDISSFIMELMSPRGSSNVSPETVLLSLPHLQKRGLVITHMEAAKLDNEGIQTPDFDYAVLGLCKNGDDNWNSHHDVDRITKVVIENLEQAIESPIEYIFEVWVVDCKDIIS